MGIFLKEAIMKSYRTIALRALALATIVAVSSVASTRLHAQKLPNTTGACDGATFNIPFDDVNPISIFFCSIATAYFSGLASGTSATTYAPTDPTTREQMSAFVTRTLDQTLKRGSQQAALNQWETPTTVPMSARTTVGLAPVFVAADGQDLWVTNNSGGSVSRVRASDGRLIDTYTGTVLAFGVLVARGRIYVIGGSSPGVLYEIDPRLAPAAPGAVIPRATLPNNPSGITTDGAFIWTTQTNSVSKTDPDTGVVTTYTTGFAAPIGILFDGANIWVTDAGDDTIKKLDANGVILDTVPVGADPAYPVFDGINIWVPNSAGNSVTVVRALGTAATGAGRVIATLTGNGLAAPYQAAFDGQYILITNTTGGAESVSLWKATDLTPQGSFPAASISLRGACSDGFYFWVVLNSQNALARF
jgi:S-layer family protein